MKTKRYRLLGVDVDAMINTDLLDVMAEAVAANRRCLMANHNLHSIYLHHHDSRFAEMYGRSDCIYIDGMPIVFMAKILGMPLKREHRTTLLDSFDWMVGEMAGRNWRLFYLGSKPGLADRGAEMLRKRFPGLQIATQHGYFDARPGSPENQKVLETINAFRPHVLMVGMGMPRQEHWVAENLDAISANAIYTAGACMDWVAGDIPAPPLWAGPLGLYGLIRLLNEPRRLWKRYLIEPWFVLGLFLRDLWQIQGEAQRKPASSRESLEERQRASAD